jgi:BioD-like phosphotransacetylase family protein
MSRSAASVSVRRSSSFFATSCSRGSPNLPVCCFLVDASNADIAALVGAKIVLVANGGLGNSFDELQLNRTMCEKVGVEIAGVIINKVLPEKYEQTKRYLTLALEQKWGPDVPLLGCIPDRPFLGCPALADLERLFDASLVSGAEHRLRHYRVQDLTLIATSLEVFLKNLRKNRVARKRTLYVCHASRNDILLGYLMESVQRSQARQRHRHSSTTTTLVANDDENENWETAMVVTGCDEYPISTQVLEIVTSLPPSAPPVLMTAARTDLVMQGIYQYTPKLNHEDSNRVEIAVQHYQPYIDFDLLLDRIAIDTNLDRAVSRTT